MKKKIYDDILKMFISDEMYRPNLLDPFFIGELAIATNAHIMIFFNKKLCSKLKAYSGKNDVLAVIPKERNENLSISLETINYAIAKLPLIDEMQEEKKECEACDGDGVVAYRFEYGFGDYEIEEECPICKGEGEIKESISTGKKIIDHKMDLKIKGSAFRVEYLEKIVKVAELLKEDKITLTYMSEPCEASIFKIGDDVEILLAPVMEYPISIDEEPLIQIC